MKILIDTREKAPLDFSEFGCETEAGTLASGDYSLRGLETIAAIERKSEDDLLMCLTSERRRFEAELARLRGYDLKAVVCETTWHRLARGMYKSRMTPVSCLQSIIGLSVRYGIQFIMADTRRGASFMVFHMLRHFLEQRQKELKVLIKAHGDNAA